MPKISEKQISFIYRLVHEHFAPRKDWVDYRTRQLFEIQTGTKATSLHDLSSEQASDFINSIQSGECKRKATIEQDKQIKEMEMQFAEAKLERDSFKAKMAKQYESQKTNL